MAKATQTTTPNKGGEPSAKVVQKSIDDPNSQTPDDLKEIFGEGGEGQGQDQPDLQYDSHGRLIETPQFEKADEIDDGDKGDGEPTPGEGDGEPDPDDPDKGKKKEPTQAAGEGKDKDVPPSLDKAALLELLPEKFRGEDLDESLKKLTGAYSEVESAHGSTTQELAQATRILKGLGQQYAPKPAAPPTVPAAPAAAPTAPVQPAMSAEEEQALNAILQDVDILADPVTPLKNVYLLAKRVAQQEADARVLHYDAVRNRVDQFNRFKAEHPDLDSHRNEMLEVLQANPHLDNPESVELVFNKAVEIKQARQVIQTKETAEQVVSNEQFTDFLKKREVEIEERVRKELEAKIQQGQAVKGTLESGSTMTVTPKDKLDKKDPTGKKRIIIKTDHGDFVTDDPELAGIITAERHEDRGLLNL